MKMRITSLLLALSLLCCLFVGCAKQEVPAAETPAAETPAAETPAEEPSPAEETPAEEAPAEEAPAEEAPTAEAPAEEAPAEEAAPAGVYNDDGSFTSAYGVTYPLNAEESVVFWKPYENFFTAFGTTYADFPGVLAFEEATGVTIKFIEVSSNASTEQYQLMIASGDWPDISGTSYYTGGAITAYTDDVILDLTDDIPAYAPDMWSYTANLSDDEYAGLFTDGMILGTIHIEHDNYQDEGNVTRGDWLDAMGMEVPQDFDAFTELLYAIQENYQTEYTYKIGTDGIMIGMQDVFDTEFANLASSSGSLTLYRQGDTLLNAGTQDNYRSYLELVAQLYQDGILNNEFFTTSIDRNTGMSITGTGKVGVWADRANNAVEYLSYLDEANQDFRLDYLPIYTGADGVNDYMDNPNRISTSAEASMGVYSSCENVELVLNMLNYCFTEPGLMLTNYGVEGVSYTLDEAGQPVYTDAVLNPSVGSSNEASRYYTWSFTSTYDDKSRLLPLYSQEVIDVIDLWNDWSVMSWDTVIPSAAGLDAAEQDSVTNEMTDLNTLQVEYILRFITGDQALNDANWQSYLDIMEANGLSHVLEVYRVMPPATRSPSVSFFAAPKGTTRCWRDWKPVFLLILRS